MIATLEPDREAELVPCSDQTAGRSTALAAAYALLAEHHRDLNGLCQGCPSILAGPFRVRCLVAERALRTIETHGVAVWDLRPVRTSPIHPYGVGVSAHAEGER